MKRKIVVLITLVILLFPLFLQKALASSTTITAEKLKKVDQYVNEQFKEAGIVGGSYAIISGENLIEAKGVGYSDLKLKQEAGPETIYSIASLTKVLTATAILQLQEQGKLMVDDSVQKYLPWFSYLDEEKSKKVTIKHLLTHSAGINRFEADGVIFLDEKNNRNSLEASIKALKSVEMQYEPGTKGQYCNSCYNTLGLIIEKVSGFSYYDYMRNFVYQPLGMKKTIYGEQLHQVPNQDLAKEYSWFFGFRNTKLENYQTFGASQDPEGGVYTNVIDLAKYVSAVFGYDSLLKKESIATSVEGFVSTEQEHWQYSTSGFEVGEVSNRLTLYKGGDGVGSAGVMMMMPEEKIGVVLMIGESNSEPKQSIAKGMLQILIGETPENDDYPVPLFKMAGMIMLMVSLVSLLILIWIGWSVYRRVKGRNRKIKRRWPRLVVSFISVIPIILIGLLFANVRPTQIGMYGYPYDIAIGLIFLAFAMLVTVLYNVYLSVLGKIN
ncbi:serine hydrolase domain-containing protein [Pseudoneobacillus sp. C159]